MKKLLKLEDVAPKLPFQIRKGYSMPYIKDWISNRYNDVIDWNVYLPTKGMNLQRGFVWTGQQKEELIKSVLKEIYIPPISVVQYREYDDNKLGLNRQTTYKIIDGKQRFSTILSYAKGEFSIDHKGHDYFISDLDKDAARRILLMMPVFDIVFEYPDTRISDDNLIRWFELINFAGTPQDKSHFEKLKQK